MVMNSEHDLIEKLRTLTPDKRQEVRDFVDFLAQRPRPQPSGEDLYGLWADLDITLSPEDLAEARREMWANFPDALCETRGLT